MIALDELIHEHTITEICFWKLDVEGAELLALKGACTALEKQSIKNIFVECHPDSFSEVKALLTKHNYRLHYLKQDTLIEFKDDFIQETTDLVARPN